MTTPPAAVRDVEVLNAEASALVRRGLQLIGEDRPGAPAAALACFDRALALRLTLPVTQSPHLQYDLAGTWLNRAAILVGTGSEADLAAAMAAYDAALAWLGRLPLASDPRVPRRLAIAHQNRGMALLLHRRPPLEAAMSEFRAALRVLGHAVSQAVDDRNYLAATAWVSLADAQATEGSAASCRDAMASARQALYLIGATERADSNAAAVGLKARHVCCRAVAQCLSQPRARPASLDDVHAGTDAADDGLSLARHWEAQGVTRFRAVADDLFRFGAAVYARHQPRFFAEFVIEHRAGTTLPGDRAAGASGALALVFSGR